MKHAIENRISRRTYENIDLSIYEINEINKYIDDINEKSNLTLSLLIDASSAFSSLKKSYGLFHNVKSIILLKGNSLDVDLKEKAGYYGEELVLKLTTMGLGTCWIGATFDKEKLSIDDGEQLVCVITVGNVKELSMKEKLIRTALSKKRKSIEQRLISDRPIIEQWLIDAINAVILAPSANNSQKPVFVYKDNVLTASVDNDSEFDLVDLGIAKMHFEIASNKKFKLGNKVTLV